MRNGYWNVLQEEIAVRSEPARWVPFEPFSGSKKPDGYWEKVQQIDWAMEHVMFGADDFWAEKGLGRTTFLGGFDHYRSASEAIADYALAQHGVYGFNVSHGTHLEGPELVDFGWCWISKYVMYVIRHGFEFLDWIEEIYGKEKAIATAVCLELVFCEQVHEQGADENTYKCYVPSNYCSFGVFIWEQVVEDYREGRIPLESLSCRGPIETIDPSLIRSCPGPGVLDADGVRVIKRE